MGFVRPGAVLVAVIFTSLGFSSAANARASLSQLQAAIDALTARVEMLEAENQALRNRLACVSPASDSTDLYFENCNVHVRNGVGSTNSINGRGNLIVGYDQDRPTGSDKTGSHNLVIGDYHNYTSFGGFVAGFRNNISGNQASVLGGQSNTASGLMSSVSGGFGNTASAFGSSIGGGNSNTAAGAGSSVSGGRARNVAGTDDWGAGSLFEDD